MNEAWKAQKATGQHGQFGEVSHDEATDLTLAADLDLSTWTRAQVDEKLAELYNDRYTYEHRLASHNDHLAHLVGKDLRPQDRWNATATPAEVEERIALARDREGGPEFTYIDSDMLKYADKRNDCLAAIDKIQHEMDKYETEFDARGGWTRAFLVNNANGHVHSSMGCSTCFPTTRYHWVTEYSGADENTIVDAAGERACTVCYPSAPVETLNRPTKMFTPDEVQAQKDREARAAAKVERDAKKIEKALTADGSEFEIEYEWMAGRKQKERFKTEQAATSWLVGKAVDLRFWPDRKPEPGLPEAMDKVKRAIAEKHGMTTDEVDAMLEKKIKAKAKRDGWI